MQHKEAHCQPFLPAISNLVAWHKPQAADVAYLRGMEKNHHSCHSLIIILCATSNNYFRRPDNDHQTGHQVTPICYKSTR
jgi:hypothetical protein